MTGSDAAAPEARGCRVLMVAPTPFFADRGCHVRILGEIRALQDAGCDVLLCTYHNGRDVDGVETVRIPTVPWYDKLEAGPSNHKYYLDLLLAGKALAAGRRFRPDVIHGHLHEGAFIGRLLRRALGRPLVFDYQGSLTDELASHGYAAREGAVLRAMGAVEDWIDAGADRVVTSTTRAGRRLSEKIGESRVVAVPDGVDTEEFRPLDDAGRREVRRRHGVSEDAVVAVYVGVLAPYQGIDLLLENLAGTLESVPDLRVLIVGYPAEEYRRRVEGTGLADRVTFTGKVPFERTPGLTAAADIALTPKISESEGNLKVYNYLACGLPVVAFDSPVNRDILGDLGVYAPHGDGAAFCAELGKLARDPERRDRLGAAGRRRAVEELSWKRAAADLLRVYAAVGGGPPVERPTASDPAAA